MKILGTEFSNMQIFSIIAVIIFLGSMVFMYMRVGAAPRPKQNITYTSGTVFGNATFFRYKPYIYFDTSKNIPKSVHDKINAYVDYIDYKKGIISLRDADYEAQVYTLLSKNNITVYVPAEFILNPDVTVITKTGTTNMTLKMFKFEIPTHREFTDGSTITVTVPAIIRNNMILRYGTPQMQIQKKKMSFNAKISKLNNMMLKCKLSWDSQFDFNPNASSESNITSHVQIPNISYNKYFYLKSEPTQAQISKLKNLPCVDSVNEQTVYIKDNCRPNVTSIYTIVNKSEIIYPDIYAVFGNANNGSSCDDLENYGLGPSSILNEQRNYEYMALSNQNGMNVSSMYMSNKTLNIGSIVNVTTEVYTTGNTILSSVDVQ